MYRLYMHSPFSEWKQGDLMSSPHVCISVGTHSVEDDTILLSSELMSEQEIDNAVEALKSELEEFRITAKQELQRLKQLMHN